MRINKVRVRNYRVLEDITVEFDNAITVIGGLNESGKSTLFEAIHRGLVLDPQAGGQVRESMRTAFVDANPEVIVDFTTDATRYTVHKTFSGQSGKISLTALGQPALSGADAEKKLARLIGIPELLGAQQRALDASFAMFFVRQGRSLENSAEIIPPAGQLMELLQRDGSAGLLASEADLKLDRVVREAVDEHYPPGRGGFKANSPAERTKNLFEQAKLEANAAATKLSRLQTLSRDVIEADKQLAESREALKSIELKLSDARANLVRAVQARQEMESAEALAKAEEEKLRHFNRSCDDLVVKTKDLDDVAKLKAQNDKKLTDARELVKENTELLSTAQAEARLAEQAVVGAKGELALAEAFVESFTTKNIHEALLKKSETIRKLREERANLAAKLEPLALLTKKAFKDIRELGDELVRLRARRDAVATGITLKSASCAVTLDGKALLAGDRAIATSEALISVGPHAVIQVSPGGGQTLDELREEISKNEKTYAAKLARVGAPNLAKAEELLESKEEAKRKTDEIDSKLEELIENPTGFDEALSVAKVARENAEKTLEELLAATVQPPAADSLEAAKALVAKAKGGLRTAEEAENFARGHTERVRAQSVAGIEADSALREGISGNQAKIDMLKSRISELVKELGDEPVRLERAASLRKAAEELRNQADDRKKTAAANDPDEIRHQVGALERDELTQNRKIESAKEKRTTSMAQLRADGVTNPHEEAAVALARQEQAREAFESASGKASALLLLEKLFIEQKKLINEKQAAPLVGRIRDYLTPLFGPGTTVEPVWEDRNAGFKTLRLSRPDRPREGALPVEVLSGGAREQVGAALRLALAELSLISTNEGITVVLDDAFVNTDSERARKLMPMLLKASRNGIQVIVLSCNPRDYEGLGAARVDMPAPAVR